MAILNPYLQTNSAYSNQANIGGSYNLTQPVNNYNPYISPTSNNVGQMNNIVIGIQGLDAAKAYPLAPNTRGYFFDMEKDFIYIKEIGPDGVQKAPIKIYGCTEITEEELKKPTTPVVNIPSNVITTENLSNYLDGYLSSYLDSHNYRPWIPKSERKKNEE